MLQDIGLLLQERGFMDQDLSERQREERLTKTGATEEVEDDSDGAHTLQ